VKIAILIGTRPGIIKMSPLADECERRGVPHILIHTGQHFSHSMDQQIMDDVGLTGVDYQIVRPEDCVTHAQQTAYMLTNIEDVLLREKPDVLLVCGDANTNLAGALAARKLHVAVGHVEAGLRSFDWRMPEEHNRVIIDHISEYLFAPTANSKKHLIDDGVQGKIFIVGNTIVDATLRHAEDRPADIERRITSLTDGEPYVILTTHREENVDDREVMLRLVLALEQISQNTDIRIVFPVHPRTALRIRNFGLQQRFDDLSQLVFSEPLGYRMFLHLLRDARFVLTDSGGIQEESCILQTPCLTLRESTERPETIRVGANRIGGTATEKIVAAFHDLTDENGSRSGWPNPFGDGKASQRIIEVCLSSELKDEFVEVSDG